MKRIADYTNTTFIEWWSQLNAALAVLDEPEALYRKAKDYYEMAYTPALAAKDIKICREIAP